MEAAYEQKRNELKLFEKNKSKNYEMLNVDKTNYRANTSSSVNGHEFCIPDSICQFC